MQLSVVSVPWVCCAPLERKELHPTHILSVSSLGPVAVALWGPASWRRQGVVPVSRVHLVADHTLLSLVCLSRYDA